jgi:hypothetical protein
VIRADVVGRTDGLESFGSSGIVDRHGTVVNADTSPAPLRRSRPS